jgi:hypothetical protein
MIGCIIVTAVYHNVSLLNKPVLQVVLVDHVTY